MKLLLTFRMISFMGLILMMSMSFIGCNQKETVSEFVADEDSFIEFKFEFKDKELVSLDLSRKVFSCEFLEKSSELIQAKFRKGVPHVVALLDFPPDIPFKQCMATGRVFLGFGVGVVLRRLTDLDDGCIEMLWGAEDGHQSFLSLENFVDYLKSVVATNSHVIGFINRETNEECHLGNDEGEGMGVMDRAVILKVFDSYSSGEYSLRELLADWPIESIENHTVYFPCMDIGCMVFGMIESFALRRVSMQDVGKQLEMFNARSSYQ